MGRWNAYHPGSSRTPPRGRQPRHPVLRMGSPWHCGLKRQSSSVLRILGTCSLGQRFTGTVQWWQRWLGFLSHLIIVCLPAMRKSGRAARWQSWGHIIPDADQAFPATAAGHRQGLLQASQHPCHCKRRSEVQEKLEAAAKAADGMTS